MIHRLPSAAECAQLLAQDAWGVVQDLLPGAIRQGHEARAGSIHGGAGRNGGSLSVRLSGARAGRWADFGGDPSHRGDLLDLAALSRFGGDRSAAWRWALRRLGHVPPGEGAVAPSSALAPAPPPMEDRRHAVEADETRRRLRARALFLAAHPLTGDDPASRYLAHRGIDLRELGHKPRALRFHPSCWCAEAGGPLPAMVAAVMDVQGQHIATHRTWLRPDGPAWRKAILLHAKKVLGGFAGGFIPLARGASRRPIKDAPEAEEVAIAEGIEDALSVALLVPELRVLSALSLSNMGRVQLPPQIGSVILCGDNDDPASPAALALRRAIDAHAAAGRRVRLAHSPIGKDFNDAVQMGRANG